MTITHVDATQIVDPMNNQLRTCFALEKLDGERTLTYNVPQDDSVGTGYEYFKMLKIGEHYFYFNKSKGTEGSLFSTKQVNFNIGHGQHDLDNGVYPKTILEIPQEVDVKNYILGVDSAIEKAGTNIKLEIDRYRYFEDYNHNLYIETYYINIALNSKFTTHKGTTAYIYPAEQFVFDGISLTKFKTEGVPIFDMRQGIDTVSEAVLLVPTESISVLTELPVHG